MDRGARCARGRKGLRFRRRGVDRSGGARGGRYRTQRRASQRGSCHTRALSKFGPKLGTGEYAKAPNPSSPPRGGQWAPNGRVGGERRRAPRTRTTQRRLTRAAPERRGVQSPSSQLPLAITASVRESKAFAQADWTRTCASPMTRGTGRPLKYRTVDAACFSDVIPCGMSGFRNVLGPLGSCAPFRASSSSILRSLTCRGVQLVQVDVQVQQLLELGIPSGSWLTFGTPREPRRVLSLSIWGERRRAAPGHTEPRRRGARWAHSSCRAPRAGQPECGRA
jgi:hypothetical protein